jgi:hypothetical protein
MKGNVDQTSEASSLRPLSRSELDALVAIMPAWLHQRAWHPPEGANVPLLWKYIDRQGLGGALGALAVAGLMPTCELGELAKARYFTNILYCEQARRTCRKILVAAQQLDIPIVNFKGPVLSQQAYIDPGIRAFADLDLCARSRADVFTLMDALGAKIDEDSDHEGIVRRMRAPGRVLATFDGWEIEIRYPATQAADPLLDLLYSYDYRSKPREDDCFATPDPAWHLVLLVLHLSWYHYYSRLVWFLDLAALVARSGKQIDFEWVSQESERLRATNLLALSSRFCRMNIDPSFPEFPLNSAAWNYRFLCLVTNPRTISREKFSLHQRTIRGLLFILWLRAIRFFLLADPPPRYRPDCPPEQWMVATIILGMRSNGRVTRLAAGVVVNLMFRPLARLSAFIATMTGGVS